MATNNTKDILSLGALELQDISSSLPGLKHSPGISSWVLTSKEIDVYTDFEQVPEAITTQIRPHMFPPKAEDAEKFHLNRCIRVLPHHQDTGGFFIAVLKKLALLPWESPKTSGGSTVDVSREVENSKHNGPQPKRRRIQGYREDPFVFFKEDEPVWPLIKDFYEMKPELPLDCLLTRCHVGKRKNIYFVSPAIRDIIDKNQDKVKRKRDLATNLTFPALLTRIRGGPLQAQNVIALNILLLDGPSRHATYRRVALPRILLQWEWQLLLIGQTLSSGRGPAPFTKSLTGAPVKASSQLLVRSVRYTHMMLSQSKKHNSSPARLSYTLPSDKKVQSPRDNSGLRETRGIGGHSESFEIPPDSPYHNFLIQFSEHQSVPENNLDSSCVLSVWNDQFYSEPDKNH
ncbi:hypothetical protein J6590_044362 [Homalodisca vitripennis]|nr:hypothetical protein J6590_044362 [Homalodisca vitripennis]